ncbi:hypothetical protein [Nocardia sp. NPDC057227]|uniref:hypothetical protein n=1 Tax=Nocardia sp. NPDC057227 TaxID=3346056 RepID=UPI0036378B6A
MKSIAPHSDSDYRLLQRLLDGGRPHAVRTWAACYLAAMLTGDRPAHAVRHPLGFVCFPVFREAGHGVCLHVWTEGVRSSSTTSAIHAHSWDLVSTVLYGEVGNEVVEIDAGGVAPTHRLYEIHSGRDGDQVRGTDRMVSYRRRSREFFRRGDVYDLPHGVFHVSEVGGEAATVALGRDRHGRPDLSLAPPHVHDHRVHRTVCTPEETRRVAGLVLARLRDDATSDRRPDE